MKISENILDILADCTTQGNILFLPDVQLPRNVYTAVNKCLTNIGGTWNRKAEGHVFDYDPAEALENLIFTGETEDMKKSFQFFPTPTDVAERLCCLANLDTAQIGNILEPSCGRGDLADVIYAHNHNLTCLELNEAMSVHLSGKPYPVSLNVDFLKYTGGSFDRIIMNPPFSKQQDIAHLYHAFDLLSPGGALVSVMSHSPFFRTNSKSVQFREWLDDHNAEVHDIEAGAFAKSGTMVRANIVLIKK